MFLFWTIFAIKSLLFVKVEARDPPHVIVILADDLGWNDVSWNNKEMVTPRMEAMAAGGVRLEKSYVHSKCSPSRAALLTGRYAWRMGLQRGAIERYLPTGLNTSIKILPQYLKEAGYSTHLVGKWHLGYCNEAYLPTRRGFDSFFGQYNHVTNYYTRMTENKKYTDEEGYDLHDNEEVSYEGKGEFSTDLFTRKAIEVIAKHDQQNPLFLYLAYQAPHGPIMEPPEQYRSPYVNKRLSSLRSLHMASTITALDSGIGKVYDALKEYGLYENSVIIFSTDNGGSVTSSSNLPLKGNKEQLYEGGVRGVGFVNSPLLKNPGTVSTSLMFITDWFSTILGLANLWHVIPEDSDSYSMWKTLTNSRKKSPRHNIVLNIDQDLFDGTWSGAVIKKNYKLIWGQDYLLKQKMPEKSCKTELFNIKLDPSERQNLAVEGKMKKKVTELKKLLMDEYRSGRYTEADYPPGDPSGYPSHFNGILSPGWCDARV